MGHYWGEQIGGAWVGGYIVMPGVPGIGDAGHTLSLTLNLSMMMRRKPVTSITIIS